MKNILSLVMIVLSGLTKAQDSAYCYNSGLVSSRTESSAPAVSENKLTNSLILMPYVMNEKEVVSLLKEKKNSALEKLLTKIKLSKNLRLVGFAAIPAGIVGALSIADGNKNGSSQNIGFGFIGLSAVSLSSGFYFNYERKKNYKKAIAKYNQLYN